MTSGTLRSIVLLFVLATLLLSACQSARVAEPAATASKPALAAMTKTPVPPITPSPTPKATISRTARPSTATRPAATATGTQTGAELILQGWSQVYSQQDLAEYRVSDEKRLRLLQGLTEVDRGYIHDIRAVRSEVFSYDFLKRKTKSVVWESPVIVAGPFVRMRPDGLFSLEEMNAPLSPEVFAYVQKSYQKQFNKEWKQPLLLKPPNIIVLPVLMPVERQGDLEDPHNWRLEFALLEPEFPDHPTVISHVTYWSFDWDRADPWLNPARREFSIDADYVLMIAPGIEKKIKPGDVYRLKFEVAGQTTDTAGWTNRAAALMQLTSGPSSDAFFERLTSKKSVPENQFLGVVTHFLFADR